jgi:hypothetical protein
MVAVRSSPILRTIPFLIALCSLALPVHAKYGGGTGKPNDPYLIYTAEQIDTIGTEPNDWSKHFKLMADLDLAGMILNAGIKCRNPGIACGDVIFLLMFDF